MFKNKLIYSLILARSGSKSIKDKNISLINGMPLIYYSINSSKKSKFIDKTIVLTDSKKYALISKRFGAEIPYLRSKKVSGDKTSDFETINNFFVNFKKLSYRFPDYIVHLRPTSPIRDSKIIDDAIRKFINSKGYTSLRSIHEMEESAYKTVEILKKKLVSSIKLNSQLDKINSSRQSFPKTYYTNGYVDILSTEFILNKKKLHGNKVFPYITKDPFDIDSQNKLEYINYLFKKKIKI